MSRTACSGRAVESTIIALSPPVSATSAASGARCSAMARSMRLAVPVEPVKQTPSMRGSVTRAAPTVAPLPGRSCTAPCGMPASCMSRTARAAMSGVCSAGFAITALPAASAPKIWPEKIASGKFQGEMQAMAPRGGALAIAAQAQRLARVEAREVAGLAHLRHAVGQRFAGFAGGEGEEFGCVLLVEIGHAAKQPRPLLDARRGPRLRAVPCRL